MTFSISLCVVVSCVLLQTSLFRSVSDSWLIFWLRFRLSGSIVRLSVVYCCIHLPSQNEFKIIFAIQARLGLRPMGRCLNASATWGLENRGCIGYPWQETEPTSKPLSKGHLSLYECAEEGWNRPHWCMGYKDPFTKQIKPITGQRKYFRHQLSIFVPAEDQPTTSTSQSKAVYKLDVSWVFCLLVSIGYIVSTMAPTVTAATSLGTPLSLPLLVFGGFFLKNT